jgi:colanic acid biosynthesis glycosyl transferase WcaI
MSDNGRRRARLLVLNQYYWPGREATANLLTELCEELAHDFDVTVVTGSAGDEPRRSERNGVEIVRVHSTEYDRRLLTRRATNYFTYAGGALSEALRQARPDIVLSMTDPPFLGAIGEVVAKRFGARFVVISQDVFPEIAVQLRRLRNPLLVRVLGGLVGFYLRRADRVVAIGDTMRERLEAKGARPERLRVIPNWVDTKRIHPEPRDNEWARANGFAGKFVVMHSGNVGHAQDLDALVRAASLLRDLDDLSVVVVGGGARYRALRSLAEVLETDQVQFLPYQPRSVLPQSLSTADVHVVGLARGLAGFVVPSRLYGVLAAGRPVIAAAEESTETARLVREVGCGVVVPPGRPAELAWTIRELRERRDELDEMGRRGREYVVAEADSSVAVRRYRELLEEVVGA